MTTVIIDLVQKGSTILDLGCRTGGLTKVLIEKVGFDLFYPDKERVVVRHMPINDHFPNINMNIKLMTSIKNIL